MYGIKFKSIWIFLYISILFYTASPTISSSVSVPINRLVLNSKNAHKMDSSHDGKTVPRSSKNEDQVTKEQEKENDEEETSQITDLSGTECGDWKHVCIEINGLSKTGNPEINDIYCIYECDVNNYIKFESQNTCSYYIKWIPNHYIIYSYKHVRYGTISNHLFAAARDCDKDLNGYQHLSTCNFWNTFDQNDELQTEHNVSVQPSLQNANQCTTPTGLHVSMDKGEIAAIIIIVLAIFVVAFGGAMRYH